jgi:hypothetical protein
MTYLEAHIIANTVLLVAILLLWALIVSIKKLCQSPTERAFEKLIEEIRQKETIQGGPTLGCGDTCCDCTEF